MLRTTSMYHRKRSPSRRLVSMFGQRELRLALPESPQTAGYPRHRQVRCAFRALPTAEASRFRSPLAHQDVDKLKGMKWLLAMVSKGRDVSEFFSDVVKNMAVRSVEVKKMVYIYLVHYADNDAQCRELALLSINSFQNDLRGSNQVWIRLCAGQDGKITC